MLIQLRDYIPAPRRAYMSQREGFARALATLAVWFSVRRSHTTKRLSHPYAVVLREKLNFRNLCFVKSALCAGGAAMCQLRIFRAYW